MVVKAVVQDEVENTLCKSLIQVSDSCTHSEAMRLLRAAL